MGDKRKRSQLPAEDDAVEVTEVRQKKSKNSDKERKIDKSKKERKEKREKKEKKEKEEKEKNQDNEVRDDVEVNGNYPDVEMNLANGAAEDDVEKKVKEKKAKDGGETAEEERDKKRKEKKKNRKGIKDKQKVEGGREEKEEHENSAEQLGSQPEQKKEKKRNKDKDKKDKTGTTLTNRHGEITEETHVVETDVAAENGVDENIDGASGHDGEKKNLRLIAFIGNLPFHTTLEAVQKHFAKIEPNDIRLPSEKGGKKGRGFAFIEFDRYDRMKTCLKLYHHSLFDDGKNPARKINVELT
ncbi:conserved hypothetical protein [Histoplasma capsulatum H143]|uniref:RRM domain-containing protein n=1 Tax=Ajellomyces capsulatus (strain H143) TaxID=544712 RepID=C6HLT8_AJECH|nr:conserved hypothetical protein [Histoplasma capsulatum H143]